MSAEIKLAATLTGGWIKQLNRVDYLTADWATNYHIHLSTMMGLPATLLSLLLLIQVSAGLNATTCNRGQQHDTIRNADINPLSGPIMEVGKIFVVLSYASVGSILRAESSSSGDALHILD